MGGSDPNLLRGLDDGFEKAFSISFALTQLEICLVGGEKWQVRPASAEGQILLAAYYDLQLLWVLKGCL